MSSPMYDIIGDIHGHYDELHALLIKMGYTYDPAAHHFAPPPRRQAIFVGDYIDRGTENLKVIDLVRNMVEAGHAQAIQGNHDFNAVHWTIPDPRFPGEYQRDHSEKNFRTHRTFLDEIAGRDSEYRAAIAWIKTLPIYLKLGNDNIVHACWHQPSIDYLRQNGFIDDKGLITEKGWDASGDEASPAYAHFEILLKGPEEEIAPEHAYADAQGIERKKARIAWWLETASTFDEAYTSLPPNLAFAKAAYNGAGTLGGHIRAALARLPAKERIFIGHIWEKGDPKPLSPRVACVDYSVAGGDRLVAYRTQAHETGFSLENYTWVTCDEVRALKSTPAPLRQPV